MGVVHRTEDTKLSCSPALKSVHLQGSGMRQFPIFRGLFASFVLVLLMVCSCNRKTPCDNLVYKEEGLTRTEFLPCAAEIIATMDKLDAQMDAVVKGDKRARAEARAQYDDLRELIKKAGGRNLVERWQDESLTRLNVRIWNAYTSYQGALLYPNDVDANAARRSKEEARGIYESLR